MEHGKEYALYDSIHTKFGNRRNSCVATGARAVFSTGRAGQLVAGGQEEGFPGAVVWVLGA